MAFRANSYPVLSTTGTPVQVVDAQAGDLEVWIYCDTGSSISAIFLGGDDQVSSSTGFERNSSQPELHTHVRPGDELWALASGATFTVHVLTRSA